MVHPRTTASIWQAPPDSAPDVVFVVRGRNPNAHPGVVAGLETLVGEGVLRGATTVALGDDSDVRPGISSWHRVFEEVRERDSEYVVLHHFHSRRLPDARPALEQLRGLPSRPLIALTCGDAFYNGLFFRPAFPPMFLQAAQLSDVVFLTSMGDVADLVQQKVERPVALLPLGACQVRFGKAGRPVLTRPDFKVVFIGSNNRPRNPAKGYHWYARKRERLVRALSQRFGEDFGLFGYGWHGVPGWRGPIPFSEQEAVCRQSAVVVGGVPFSPARYYLSNRPFNQILSGTPFVDMYVEGVDTLLRDGEHWHLAPTIADVVERCEEVLGLTPDERHELGVAASSFVAERHTDAARCRSLIATLMAVRQAGSGEDVWPAPDLSFFLPEVDPVAELPRATRGWRLSAAAGSS